MVYLYYLFIIIVSLTGIIVFWKSPKLTNKPYSNLRIKKNRYNLTKDYVKEILQQKEIDKALQNSGLKFSSLQYQLARYTIFTSWLILIHAMYFIHKIKYPIDYVLTIMLFFILTTPKKNILGRKTLFKIGLDLFTNEHKHKVNLELYRAISQLKNISIIKKNNPTGSQFILEQITKFTYITKPIFNRMLAYWNTGDKEKACRYFKEAIDTPIGDELANIFLKIDSLNPIELKNQLILYQETIRRERETEKEGSNENKSNVIYMFAVISAIVIMVNFIVVAYYIESMEMMKYL